jgi:ribose transport system ATP-binding protein
VNDLTVYENMFLGSELRTRAGFVDGKAMSARSAEILSLLDVRCDPRALVGTLDASYKQVVEIGRALLFDAKILIMDEPTTSLTEHEIAHLFKVMRSVSQRGVAVVFISHKLKEITTVCGGYTVLRDGVVMNHGRIADPGVNEPYLANLMVGRDIASLQFYEARTLGDPILEVSGLSRPGEFSDVSFTLRKGEILGFTGLLGDGRTELFQCIFGDRPKYQGHIRVRGVDRRMTSPSRAQKSGLGYAPRNRKENAIVKDFSVRENITLATLQSFVRGLFVDARRELARCTEHIKNLHIKAESASIPITSLSGGNQQKVVLAKWLEAGSDVLILDNPTQGIDIGAKADIYRLIQTLARDGKAVVVLSSELPELLKVCDRIVVMYHGRIVGSLDRSQADEQRLMQYATGAVMDPAVATPTPPTGRA